MTTLETVELRDEAVRILHRAIEHVQQYEYTLALRVLDCERSREWFEDVDTLAGLGCVFSERRA